MAVGPVDQRQTAGARAGGATGAGAPASLRAEVPPDPASLDPASLDPAPLDSVAIKGEFPIFDSDRCGHPLVYLDSAASSQKPRAVLDAMNTYYGTTHANVHRGVYAIAEAATAAFEAARAATARFIGAPSPRGVIFTKNATEGLNLVAHSWGRSHLRAGDTVLLTEMEHHANLVPWLMLAGERGVKLRYLRVDDNGWLDLDRLEQALDGVKLVAVTAMSNVLGTIPPVRHIAEMAHSAGAVVVVDGAQFVPHAQTRVADLGCDFFAFSAHKMFGPTGIGVVWGREEVLDEMPAFLGGGEMISDVRLDGWTPNELPWKFEAGTPPIAEAIGLGAAIEWVEAIGMAAVREHERRLTSYALSTLADRYGDALTVHGPPDGPQRGGVVSFSFGGLHAHDIAQVLDQAGVCVRASHHCAKPLMRRLNVAATTRASFSVYNDESDVDALADGLASASALFLA